MKLVEALQGAQSPRAHERSEAEYYLKLLREQDLSNFLLSLSVVLLNDTHSSDCRKEAGITVKKLLTEQWINLDPSIKSKIKESLLVSLGSLHDACHISQEIIAMIASIEKPRGEWQDLFAKLLGNMTQQGASRQLKQRTLVALGLVCEAIQVLEPEEVDGVVNAAVRGMNHAEPSSDVRFEAFKALYGVIGLAEVTFTNMDERDRIMSAVCESVKSKDLSIKHAAIDCLVEIACTHFLLLQPYMTTILSLTTECMKGDKQAADPCIMVFWSAICQEVIIHRGSVDAEHTADCLFIHDALSSLVPVLLEYLVTQEDLEEDLEGVDYDLRFTLGYDLRFSLGYDLRCQHDPRATTRCLALIARTIGDAIVPLVMDSVQTNTNAPDWHRRKAAISEIRFILEGPSVEKLAPLVHLLLHMMQDPNSEVKVVTARTLGRVFELLHSQASGNRIITTENLPHIINVLRESSEDIQSVSEKVCEAIYFLVRGYEDEESMSSELAPFIDRVVDALISASEPSVGTPFWLPVSAYEALSEIVSVSNICESGLTYVVGSLMHRIMKRLGMTLGRQALDLDDKEKKNNLLVRLCGLLQVIFQKLRSSGMAGLVAHTAVALLFLFCRVFHSDSSTVRDKAMLAIGALANCSGPDFGEHMPIFIQLYDEHFLSPISLEVIGDIFHVLEGKMLPYCDQVMEVLHKGLSELMLKPLIFSCFGDIALAIGKDFEKYRLDVLEKLKQAGDTNNCVNVKVDYANQLRLGMLKAYSGILWGIKDPEIGLEVSLRLFKFIEAVCGDQSRDESVRHAVADVLAHFHLKAKSWAEEMTEKAPTHEVTHELEPYSHPTPPPSSLLQDQTEASDLFSRAVVKRDPDGSAICFAGQVGTSMKLIEALQGAQSPHAHERSEAEYYLKLLREQDLSNFLLSLSVVLLNDTYSSDCRKESGITIKKLLTEQWINLDPSIKSKIKESLLVSLGSPHDACYISPEIIAMIASIEKPRGEWQGLVAKLLSNMTQQGASRQLKQRTLVALGLVCEAIQGLEPEEVDGVVNAAIQGIMNHAEPSADVRFEAFKALYGVLGLAEVNFINMDERDRIMSAVCESAKSKDSGIKHAAIDCLVKIACTHFLLLQPYMTTILSLTTECMKEDEQAADPCIMVFWSAICQEVTIHRGSVDAEPTADCRFIHEALSSLVPVLLEYLVTQEDLEEDLEGDDYDLRFTLGYDLRFALGYDLRCQHDPRATTRCLALIARTIGDAIVPLVMDSVQTNTNAPDWHRRKAAISEIRFILEGPSVEKLAPLVHLLLHMMQDPNSEVKVVTARTLGRVFELLHSQASGNRIITTENLPHIINVLRESSEDIQSVSEKVCEAIYFLVRGYEDEESMSSELAPFIDRVVDALISASEPSVGTPFRLPVSAYEALSEIVSVSNICESGLTYVVGCLMHRIMKRLCMTLDRQALDLDDKEKKNNLLVRLCGLLQVIIQKLRSSGMAGLVTHPADALLFLFCRVFHSDSSTVRDIAMLAIGALANASGPDFGEHMPIFIQFYDEDLLSPISLEVIGDIFHVLEGKMLPYCDQVLEVLHQGLSESTLKPLIFSCFGDIALAIGNDFEKYWQDVLEKLRQAGDTKNCDNVKVDYVNQLRLGMLKAYSGILWGIKDPEIGLEVSLCLFKFIEAVRRDQSRDERVRHAVGDVLAHFHLKAGSWAEEMTEKAMVN